MTAELAERIAAIERTIIKMGSASIVNTAFASDVELIGSAQNLHEKMDVVNHLLAGLRLTNKQDVPQELKQELQTLTVKLINHLLV